MKKLTATLLLFSMILSFGAAVYASTIEELEAELEAAEATADSIRDDISATADQRYAVERDLDVVIARKAEVEADIEANKQHIKEKEAELERIRRELQKAKEEIAAQEEAFGSRLRIMYYKKDESFWNVLFESKSIADLLSRLDQLKSITEQDKKVLEELNEKRREIERLEIQEEENYNKLLELKAKLAEDEQELIDLEAELERRREELLEKQRAFEAELEAQQAAAASIAANLDWARAEAERIAAERAAAAAESGQGTSRGAGDITIGGWVWPTEATYVTSNYGWRTHPVYGGTAWHNGVDIAGPAGTPIWASRGGLVTMSGWYGGYGNCVIIDHGDGTSSLYAHASSLNVSVGDYVSQYDVISYMGTTGTSTGNHLHFTIFVGGSDVDPGPYIGL